MIKSICIVRLSALGDVLMLVPLIRTLQANIPDVSLTWVISRPAYDLVEGLEGVEFIVIPKPGHVADYWRFNQQMRARCFDVLLATQASFRANLLYPFIRASRKIGYDALRAKDGHGWFIHERIIPGKDHTLEGFLKFADVLGMQKKQIRWDIPIPATDYQWARDHLPTGKGPIMLINPAASKSERSWLVDRYIQVIRYAQSRWHAQVVLTGGPGEHDRVLADAIMQSVPVTDLVGKTKPKQLLAVLKQADLLLCPDTGPSHMAAAVATPVIALHAVTSSRVSGPYPYRHLSVDYYPEAVRAVLQKTAETNPWGTHAHGAETMSLIPVDGVIRRLDSLLSSLGYQ
ncbi:glycosyltransferase family 9 protein [Legionella nagasakiensis]|uniref:glycosyltransferase family 9 protein n=1 Tax=Legionella nagasakiensis TaxID=535290 RepID=UPI001055E4B9|nr:glycosyltransferase family 9 protein [Legionella nagasakiensis]